MPGNRVTRQDNAIIRDNKGKETDQPRKGERRPLARPATEQGKETETPNSQDGTPQPGAETRRARNGTNSRGKLPRRDEPHARTAWERGEAGATTTDRQTMPNQQPPCPTSDQQTNHEPQPANTKQSKQRHPLLSLLSPL